MRALIHFLPHPLPVGRLRGLTACGAYDAPPDATPALADVTCRRCRRSLAYRIAMRPGSVRIPTAEEALAYTGTTAQAPA